MAKVFKVKLKRSLIGATKQQKEAIRCLGLRKINHEVEISDNSANRGQIYKVQHMLDVRVEK